MEQLDARILKLNDTASAGSPVLSVHTNCGNTKKLSCVTTQCIYGFHMIIITKSDYFFVWMN
jgi:hypothetical protein